MFSGHFKSYFDVKIVPLIPLNSLDLYTNVECTRTQEVRFIAWTNHNSHIHSYHEWRHCLFSHDFTPFIHNYSPPNSMHALECLLKLNGLRGRRERRRLQLKLYLLVSPMDSVSSEKCVIYTLLNVIFCHICVVLFGFFYHSNVWGTASLASSLASTFMWPRVNGNILTNQRKRMK